MRLTCLLLGLACLAAPLHAQTLSVKDDPAMAGQRKVAHHSLFSVESEMLTGSEAVANINSSLPINKNRALNRYLNGLVEKLASPAHTDSVARCHIYVIDSPMILVFSVPGGYLYVSTGALAQADDEGEAAALFVHDIAHFACRHWAKKVSVAMLWKFAEVPTLFFAPWPVTAAMPFPVRNSLLQKYIDTDLPGAEKEADGLGVQYLFRSGYDAESYLRVFRKMGGYINHNSDLCVPGIMCCFPTGERLNAVKAKMELYPKRERVLVDTSAFRDVKAYVEARLSEKGSSDDNQTVYKFFDPKPKGCPVQPGPEN